MPRIATGVPAEPKVSRVLQLKITLNGSLPKVWRRILVPADYSFFDLHVAIQDAMGWTDSHLHGFRITKDKIAQPLIIQYPNPEDDTDFGDRALDERVEKISDYFGVSIKQCTYEYDFGDGWEYTVLFERELPTKPGAEYPQCIGGKNACPPEDCGGLGGYDELQKIIKNPKHPEHADMLEWLGIDDPAQFDPMAFSQVEVEFEDPKRRLKAYEREFGV